VVGSSAMYWMRTTIRATLPTGPELTARIGRATIDGGNVDQNFITTNSDLYDPPADFAIGGPYLFWHWPIDDLLTDHLMRANLDGTGASVSIATFNSSLKDGLEGLTADTRQLYGVGYAGALIRMSFDGTTLSYGAPYVINRGGPMVVSGSHLYWQTENEIDGSVGIGVGTVAGAVLNNGLISHLSGSDKYGNSMRISSIAVDAFGPLAIRTLSLSPSAFSATPRGPSVSPATRRYGTSVTYTLPKQERVRFTVQRRVTGRMKHGRCVAPNLSGRHGTPCIRLDTVAGSFTRRRKAGVDRFRFTGRLAGRTLTPGSYRLLATPDADGSAAPPVTASFRISQ
jgi:hypothetical protein